MPSEKVTQRRRAAFRLLEAGISDPIEVLHEGIPTAIEGQKTEGGGDHPYVEVLGSEDPATEATLKMLAEWGGR